MLYIMIGGKLTIGHKMLDFGFQLKGKIVLYVDSNKREFNEVTEINLTSLKRFAQEGKDGRTIKTIARRK